MGLLQTLGIFLKRTLLSWKLIMHIKFVVIIGTISLCPPSIMPEEN